MDIQALVNRADANEALMDGTTGPVLAVLDRAGRTLRFSSSWKRVFRSGHSEDFANVDPWRRAVTLEVPAGASAQLPVFPDAGVRLRLLLDLDDATYERRHDGALVLRSGSGKRFRRAGEGGTETVDTSPEHDAAVIAFELR